MIKWTTEYLFRRNLLRWFTTTQQLGTSWRPFQSVSRLRILQNSDVFMLQMVGQLCNRTSDYSFPNCHEIPRPLIIVSPSASTPGDNAPQETTRRMVSPDLYLSYAFHCDNTGPASELKTICSYTTCGSRSQLAGRSLQRLPTPLSLLSRFPHLRKSFTTPETRLSAGAERAGESRERRRPPRFTKDPTTTTKDEDGIINQQPGALTQSRFLRTAENWFFLSSHPSRAALYAYAVRVA